MPHGGRLIGRAELRPLQFGEGPVHLDEAGRHRWWPVAPRAEAQVELDEPGLRFQGQGYHDANAGEEPLEAAFRRWTWTRAWTRQGVRLSYDTEPWEGPARRRTYHIGAEAPPEEDEGQEQRLPWTLWAVGRRVRLPTGGRARLRRTLEDTPFYNRSMLELDLHGEQLLAVHETVDMQRWRRPWVQTLLPFRIRREDGE